MSEKKPEETKGQVEEKGIGTYPWVRYVAIVITGLAMLQALRLTITGGSYAVKRFGIDASQTGVFIKSMLNTCEIFCITGIMLVTIYVLIRGENKQLDIYLSICFTWLNFFAFVLIFVAYYTGGKKGRLTLYYWSLVLASFLYGVHQSLVMNILTSDIAYYYMGLPFSGVQILVFHLSFRYLYKKYNLTEIELYLVLNQILMAAILWLFASAFWSLAYYHYDIKKASEEEEKEKSTSPKTDLCNGSNKEKRDSEENDDPVIKRIRNAWSPFCLNILVMMFSYVLYPAAAPYELVDPKFGYITDLVILFCSTLAATVLVLLVYLQVGPNRCWERGTFKYYHCTWIILGAHYCNMFLFFCLLHYPEAPTCKFIREHPICVCILTIFLRGFEDTIRGISITAVSMQGKKKDGDLTTICNFISQILMNIFSFLGSGYIKTYRSYKDDRDNWPTNGLGWFASVWFWLSKAGGIGWKSFLLCFTLDIRKQFQEEDVEEIFSI